MATLNDVAKLAGVAPVTVSRVINDPGAVREETRERVRKAMAQLQYIPNMAARNLVTESRSGVIDIYLPESMDLSNPFAMHFISGISEVLSQHMYSLLILRNREHEHICDGYIVTGLLRNEIFDFERYAAERSRPVVLFGHTELPGVSCINVDNVEGGRMGTRQLTELGHRRVAMINVAENKDYTADRLSGYQEALEEAGLPFRSELVVYAENSIAGGAEAAKSLLAVGGFSAVFCATDTVAVGAVSALADAGLRMPQDVSIRPFRRAGLSKSRFAQADERTAAHLRDRQNAGLGTAGADLRQGRETVQARGPGHVYRCINGPAERSRLGRTSRMKTEVQK